MQHLHQLGMVRQVLLEQQVLKVLVVQLVRLEVMDHQVQLEQVEEMERLLLVD
jgi:hypothetical protein